MELIKQHMFFILCGLVAIGGVALGVTGMSRMSDVPRQMGEASQLYSSLANMKSVPNQAWIDAQQRRIDSCKADYKTIVEQARTLNPYKPLLDKVFPNGSPDLRREFRVKYGQAFEAMLEKLRAAEPPSASDFQEIADEIYREQQQPGFSFPTAEQQWTETGVLTTEGAHVNPRARASIALPKKDRTFVYISRGREQPSFEMAAGMADVNALTPPSERDCWFAQVQLWIQQDVVDAISRINQEAESKEGAAWAADMPIKEIISVRISDGYILEGATGVAGAGAGGMQGVGPRTAARPPMSPDATFTGSYTDDNFQVLTFSLRLVMDQRIIPRLVQELSKDRFHTLLRMEYYAVEANPEMVGPIYGSDPGAIVTLDFETHMLYEPFASDWMPTVVFDHYFPG